MALTRDEILGMNDLTVVEWSVPSEVPVWGGKTIYLRPLTRGEQDAYLKSQFKQGVLKRVAGQKTAGSDIPMEDLYGHDAWLCSKGICDEDGKSLFKESDVVKLNEKLGEFIGLAAIEILKVSGMSGDKAVIEQEVKNS
jgi:hypothetical protein